MKSLIEIRFDVRDTATSFLAKMAAGIWEDQFKAMLKAVTVLAGDVRSSIKAWTSSSSYENVRRTGTLARSFVGRIVARDVRELAGLVSSDVKYAGIHEEGGDIDARKKYLTVPLKRLPVGFTARDIRNPVFFRSKKGNLILADRVRQGKKYRLELMYVLKRSVRIKPKHYLKRAEETAAPKLVEILQEQANLSIERLGGRNA